VIAAVAITAPSVLPATATERYPTGSGGTVDLELVLAVDASGSMDLAEQKLQRDGYAAAFRHPEVLAAIASGLTGRIAVVYVEWAGSEDQEVIVPWTVIASPEDAFAFADKIAAVHSLRENGTSISGALEFASRLFASSGVNALKRVIDVSGDGPNYTGPPVVPVRNRVVAEGIVINGLPIVLSRASGAYDIAEIDDYYEDCVIGGPGAFLVAVDDISRLPAAIRWKLVLEIAGIAPEPQLIRAAIAAPRIDCLIGEKKLARFLATFRH
jgi:hypothetical protein